MFSTENSEKCVPRWMPSRGEHTVVSTWPWEVLFKTDYSTERQRDGGFLRIKGWKRIVNQMDIKSWDKMFSILHYGNGGVFWFFYIYPWKNE